MSRFGGDSLKKVAEYLRRGAKLTSEHCPICDSPLVRMEGKLFCPNCEKEVMIASSEEEFIDLSAKRELMNLKGVVTSKLRALTESLKRDEKVISTIKEYLEILEKIEKILITKEEKEVKEEKRPS